MKTRKLKSRYQWGGEMYDLYKAALLKAGRCPNCAAPLPQAQKPASGQKTGVSARSAPKRKNISL